MLRTLEGKGLIVRVPEENDARYKRIVFQDKAAGIKDALRAEIEESEALLLRGISKEEKEILENSAIASVSFGAERKFGFRHNSTKEEISLMLENGSVLIMKDEVQKFWKHKLYTSTKIKEPRINLTFRTIVSK